jgi:type IV pilus assembly protein PilB
MFQTYGPVLDALRLRGHDVLQLNAAVSSATDSGKALRDVLVDDRVVTEIELADALADAYGLTSVDLSTYSIDSQATAKVPVTLARRHSVLGIGFDGEEIVVAVTDPGDVLALDDVRAATGMPVRPMVAARDELTKLIDRIARSETDLDDVAASIAAETAPTLSALTTVNEEAPIVKYVNGIIEQGIDNRASDIHLEPTEKEMRIRYRIDGVLAEVESIPAAVQGALISRIKIMSQLDITERRIPQNGRFTVDLGRRSVDMRVASMPTVWGEKLVLRVLDTGGINLNLKELGFSQSNYERFSESFAKPHGMILVTGPTGSGKSTTLYGTLMEISKPEINIITVEDPVEYRLPGINQVQVNPKAGMTFAAVLPAILRSDPDVVLVGEVRDRVTAQLAIEAALTGHLVLTTLHTNDAPSAVTRLVEMGIEPFLVGSSVDCVMAQRLARRLCHICKELRDVTEADLRAVRWPFERLGTPEQLYFPVGCRSCANTGYRGRTALHEVMPVSETIERMAVEHASATDIMKVARQEGMTQLREDGLQKVLAGTTSLAEILRVAV